MAANQPTIADLQALIQMLQGQNAAQAAPVAPAATHVVFTYTPQTLGVNDLLDYSTKRGWTIYDT